MMARSAILAVTRLKLSLLTLSALLTYAGAATQRYKSTTLQTAIATSNKTGATSPGLYFTNPGQGVGDAGGATIYKDDGTVVWHDPSSGSDVNFDLQTYDSNKYLTYWQGDYCSANGCGFGAILFFDSTYTQKFTVCVQDSSVVRYYDTPTTQPCVADYHESRVTDRGTILQSGRNVTQRDLTYIGGPKNAYILDSIFYETNIATSKVQFRWSPLDHLHQYDSLAASPFRLPQGNDGTNPQNAWDYWHLNSVAVVPDPMGGYIVSSRPLSSLFKLDSKGNIEWVVDGRAGGNFTVAPNAKFQYQHDCVPISATATTLTVSLFNNFNSDRRPNEGPSSGLVLTIDVAAKKVSLAQKFQSPPPIPMSLHGGSMQVLPNNGALVSYGGTKNVQEYDSSGTVVNALTLTAGSSYRAYKYAGWHATPAVKPDVAAFYDKSSNTTSVYISWNGATEVARWKVNGKHSRAKSGFETEITIAGNLDSVVAAAVNSTGAVIGRSNRVNTVDSG